MEAARPIFSSKYRADIDGLRAIAVLAVVLFHYSVSAVSGGFVGVDIFFVISGYLITGLLAARISETGLSLVDFYNRRVRRILPALFLIILLALAAGWLLLLPDDYTDLGRTAAYSSVGAGNLYFYRSTGYFDREAELRPLLHLWSLAVEEQFYVVWPITLAFLVWVTGGKRSIIATLIGGLTIVAFLYGVRAVANDPKAAFYLPQARAWELALGAVLVFVPPLSSRLVAEAAGIVGLALIAYAVFVLTSHDTFPGVNALWPCLGAALLVWPRWTPTLVAGVLGTFPLRRTGEISYSFYLWHWPLLVFFRYYNNGRQATPTELIVLGLTAYALAYLSWLCVERPFRRAHAGPMKALSVGLAATVLVGALGSVVVRTGGVPGRVPEAALPLQNLNLMWAWTCPHSAKLTGSENPDCVFGQPWEQATTHALLWGDSHAEHMAPLIQAAARGLPDSFLLYLPCPAALGGRVQRDPDINLPHYAELCTKVRERGIRLLDDHPEINLVILSSSWRGVSNLITVPGKVRGGPESVALMRSGIEDLIERTAAPGRRFLIVADVPQIPLDPVSCGLADWSGLLRQRCTGGLASSIFEKYQGPVYDALAGIAAGRSDTTVVFPGRPLCTGTWCEMYFDGELIYRDGSHLRRNLSEHARRGLADLFGLTAALQRLK